MWKLGQSSHSNLSLKRHLETQLPLVSIWLKLLSALVNQGVRWNFILRQYECKLIIKRLVQLFFFLNTVCKPRLSLFGAIHNLISRLVPCLLNAITARNWRCSSVILAFFSLKHLPYILGFLFVCRKNNFESRFLSFPLGSLGPSEFWHFCCSKP